MRFRHQRDQIIRCLFLYGEEQVEPLERWLQLEGLKELGPRISPLRFETFVEPKKHWGKDTRH